VDRPPTTEPQRFGEELRCTFLFAAPELQSRDSPGEPSKDDSIYGEIVFSRPSLGMARETAEILDLMEIALVAARDGYSRRRIVLTMEVANLWMIFEIQSI
jgi:hypothetical protein